MKMPVKTAADNKQSLTSEPRFMSCRPIIMHVYRRYFAKEFLDRALFDKVEKDSGKPGPHESLVGVSPDSGWRDSVEKEMKALCRHHGQRVLYGRRDSAPCSVWRTERIVLGDESLPRFSERVYLFLPGALKPWGRHLDYESAQGCYGHFLGYVSLRPPSRSEGNRAAFDPDGEKFVAQEVAVAYLVPPRWMSRPRYHILTMVAGPADGVMPFRATPYCSVHPQLTGQWRESKSSPPESQLSQCANTEGVVTGKAALCLLSSLHSALLLKMYSYGCMPISVQDMLAILWKKRNSDSPLRLVSMNDLLTRGLSLREAWEIIQDSEVGAGALLETIDGHGLGLGEDVDREQVIHEVVDEAVRCVTDYLASGMPVILYVQRTAANMREPLNHSTLIIGMHLLTDPIDDDSPCKLARDTSPPRVDSQEIPGHFVVHDLAMPPFARMDACVLLRKALVEGKIRFLAIAPHGARMKLSAVRWVAWAAVVKRQAEWEEYINQWIQQASIRGAEENSYAQAAEQLKRDPRLARFCVRLVDASEIAMRYPTSDFPEESGNGEAPESGAWWTVEIGLPWSVARKWRPFRVLCWPIGLSPDESSTDGQSELQPRVLRPTRWQRSD